MRTRHSTGSLRRSDRHQRWTWIWIATLLLAAAGYEVASHSVSVCAADSVTEGAPESPTNADDHPGNEHAGGHEDPVAPVLVGIVLILLMAKIGGDLFERVGMPAVLGELVVGVVLGNLPLLLGTDALERYFDLQVATQFALEHGENPAFNTAAMLKILASIGVILLLFEVGLESTVREVMSVGVSSLIVAVLGVVAPMVLGYLAGAVLISDAGWQVHIFIGATLCATSVGITARVLKDLGRSQDPESRIILGAAVIDDVLGLIVLAVVSGVIVAQNNPEQE